MGSKYADEKEFKNALIKYLEKDGYWVTPIQSRTVPGIPDLYAVCADRQMWIECKREHMNLKQGIKPRVKIHFRVGQQSWAAKHLVKTAGRSPVMLWVAFDDCIAFMPMKRIYENGRVDRFDFIPSLISSL